MSHYNDQGGCDNCSANGFVPLQEASKYNCGPSCTSRYLTERSTMDKMAYDFYVLGKNVGPFVPSVGTVRNTENYRHIPFRRNINRNY